MKRKTSTCDDLKRLNSIEMNFSYTTEPDDDKKPLISALIDDFASGSIDDENIFIPKGRIDS